MKLTERQIAAELEAMRPAPAPQFAAALDSRAAAGFPRDPGRGDASPPIGGWIERLRAVPARRLVPVMGAAATLAVVSAVAVSQISTSGGSGDDVLQSAQTQTADTQATTAPSTGAAAKPSAAAEGGDLAPGAKQRQVERSAQLTLSAEAGQVADVADGVVEVTDRYGGFIVSSDVSTGDRPGGSRATFDLRVPTAKLQEALSDLSGLAHVKSRNEGSLDITAPTITAQERVKDAQAEVDGLLEQLGSASSTAETDALRARLRTARAELSAARAESDSLSQRAELTAISVTVIGDGAGDGSWGIGDAADDALSILKTIAGVALVSLAILLPAALLGSLLWIALRGARRRSRERALDA